MNRQEKRGMADLRHRDRKNRLRKLLAAKPQPNRQIDPDATSLVISSARGMCSVTNENGERLVRCDLPVAPGDEVALRHEKVAAIAPRRTTLSRADPGNPHRELVLAANIDLLLIVAPLTDPPFRPGLIDRYLIAAARGGIQPVLCINKIDLCRDTQPAEIFPIPKVRCSALTGEGIDELQALIAGNLAVLAGHSGAGKSSLLNALIADTHGDARAPTGPVNRDTGKGRHTTTASRLYTLANGGRIIDTPGIRELGLGALTRAELMAAFPEFSSENCRFADCLHREEPGCAVRDPSNPRYRAWLRLA
jgi:ribosome biogenesis GTPase